MVARVSVGKLFAGGLAPGLILVASFLVYIAVRCHFQPSYGPALPKEEKVPFKELFILAKGLILPFGVVALVLGTIFSGIASPTEAAAVGVAGALLSALINRRLDWAMISDAAMRTMSISGMVMWILFGAACFTSIFFRTGGQTYIADFLLGLENPVLIFGFILAVLIVMGCFLDEITQVMITVPIFLPIIIQLGYDPVWFGVFFMTVVQIGYLTPPFGFCLFYMKGVAPPEVSMADIYRSISPFVLIQLAVVIFILVFPRCVMWLPNLLLN